MPKGVREILAIAPDQRTPAQVATVFSYWRTTVPEWKAANEQIETLWREHPEGSSQLVFQCRVTPPRMTHHAHSWAISSSPARPVAPGVPGFLNPLPPDAPARSLDVRPLAGRPQAPTTARAIVNRVWQAYFGTGLVSTERGPRHAERAAVASRAARLAGRRVHGARVEPQEPAPVDRQLGDLSAVVQGDARVAGSRPYNRLLARGPRFRVDAEVVRDVALAASGLLDPKVGGPSVFPPAPEFLFQPPTSYGPRSGRSPPAPDRYRRASARSAIARCRTRCSKRSIRRMVTSRACARTRSNTPLQALTVLNEPTFLECARALALRTLQEGGESQESQITYAFRRCLARRPTAGEVTVLLDLLRRREERFGRDGAKPWELAAADRTSPPRSPQG